VKNAFIGMGDVMKGIMYNLMKVQAVGCRLLPTGSAKLIAGTKVGTAVQTVSRVHTTR
jgi:hypothetical protein